MYNLPEKIGISKNRVVNFTYNKLTENWPVNPQKYEVNNLFEKNLHSQN